MEPRKEGMDKGIGAMNNEALVKKRNGHTRTRTGGTQSFANKTGGARRDQVCCVLRDAADDFLEHKEEIHYDKRKSIYLHVEDMLIDPV